jgi:hypothetical protein
VKYAAVKEDTMITSPKTGKLYAVHPQRLHPPQEGTDPVPVLVLSRNTWVLPIISNTPQEHQATVYNGREHLTQYSHLTDDVRFLTGPLVAWAEGDTGPVAAARLRALSTEKTRDWRQRLYEVLRPARVRADVIDSGFLTDLWPEG